MKFLTSVRAFFFRLFARLKNTSLMFRFFLTGALILFFGMFALLAFVLSSFSWSPSRLTEIDLPSYPDGTYYNQRIYGYRPLPEYSLYLFFVKHNPEINFLMLSDFIKTYKEECKSENVNLAVAFAQMCHETGFLKFGGSVKADQNNFAGIGAVSSTSPGNSFPDRTTGIRVQIQHLKAYASDEKLVNEKVDPRFQYVKRKTAEGTFDLTGKWAADKQYGIKLLKYIMEIYSYVPAEEITKSMRF
jgi:hypothetical protein